MLVTFVLNFERKRSGFSYDARYPRDYNYFRPIKQINKHQIKLSKCPPT
jgi:hypothetical protein